LDEGAFMSIGVVSIEDRRRGKELLLVNEGADEIGEGGYGAHREREDLETPCNESVLGRVER
jgi:hypothetical protein